MKYKYVTDEQVFDLINAEDQGFLLIKDIVRILQVSKGFALDATERLSCQGRINREKQPEGHWVVWKKD